MTRQDDFALFGAWFQGSKIVEPSGQPKQVYHGTCSDFKEFRPSPRGWYGQGFYFVDCPTIAGNYAFEQDQEHGQNVVPVFLSIRRPYHYRETSALFCIGNDMTNFPLVRELLDASAAKPLLDKMLQADSGYLGEQLKNALSSQGYDGLVVTSNFGAEYIVFDRSQIKFALLEPKALQQRLETADIDAEQLTQESCNEPHAY